MVARHTPSLGSSCIFTCPWSRCIQGGAQLVLRCVAKAAHVESSGRRRFRRTVLLVPDWSMEAGDGGSTPGLKHSERGKSFFSRRSSRWTSALGQVSAHEQRTAGGRWSRRQGQGADVHPARRKLELAPSRRYSYHSGRRSRWRLTARQSTLSCVNQLQTQLTVRTIGAVLRNSSRFKHCSF